MLKKSEKFLICLFIMMCILYGYYQIILLPLHTEIKKIEAENNLLLKQSKAIGSTADSSAESSELSEKMNFLLEQVPADADLAAAIAYLQESSNKAQVVLVSIASVNDTMKSGNDGSNYEIVKLELTVRGSFQGIKDLIEQLENKSRRIYQFEQIDLRVPDIYYYPNWKADGADSQQIFASPLLTARITLNMYYDYIGFNIQ
jgi:Tfp pilus assembly protein PilO